MKDIKEKQEKSGADNKVTSLAKDGLVIIENIPIHLKHFSIAKKGGKGKRDILCV